MPADDPILTWLDDRAQHELPVRLINAYRGIPIASSAKVLSLNQGSAILSVNEYQTVCMKLDGKTRIRYSQPSEVLRARVISVNVPKKEAVLTEFTKAAGSLGKRLCTRVQPTQPIDAEMRLGDLLIPCQLVDISLNGVGVILLGTFAYGDLDLRKGLRNQLHFTIPPAHRPVQLAGQITNIVTSADTNQHRLGCKTFPESSIELLLLDYVALRRDELMRELSVIYSTMRREQLKVAPFL